MADRVKSLECRLEALKLEIARKNDILHSKTGNNANGTPPATEQCLQSSARFSGPQEESLSALKEISKMCKPAHAQEKK